MTARPITEHNRAERHHIGQQLRDARTALGMTQHDLAAIAGVPQVRVSYIETAATDGLVSSLVDVAAAAGRCVVLVAEHHLPLLNLTAAEVKAVIAAAFGDPMPAGLQPALDKLTTTEETRTDG